ncbi:MAG: hypothetical protein R3Y08_06360 [Rikenellaceae bacterium]
MNKKSISLLFSLLLLVGSLVSCQKSDTDDQGGTTTLTSPLSLTLADNAASSFAVDVTIAADQECGNYVVGVVPQSIANEEFNGDGDMVAYIKEKIEAAGASYATVDNKYIFNGESTAHLSEAWEIDYLTTYIIVAFGVSESGERTTNISRCTATSAEQPLDELPMLAITVDETTATNIKVSVELNQVAPFTNYFVAPISKYDYQEDYSSNKVKVVTALLQFITNSGGSVTEPNGSTIFNKSTTVSLNNIWDLESDCDYLIFAFGLDAYGSLSGDIFTEEVRTEAFGEGFNIAFSDVSPQAYDITLHTTPEENVGNYCVFPISQADIDAGFGSSSDFELATYARNYLQYFGYNFSKADDVCIFSGEGDFKISSIVRVTSSTQYSILAFGISANGTILTPVARIDTATTAAPTLSGSLASITIDGCDSRSFDVTIDKGDFNGNYYVGVYMKKYFDSYCNSNAYTLASMFMEDEISINTDFTIADNTWIFDSSITYNTYYSWTCRPDTEYVIVAFGVNPDGAIASNILSVYGKTDPVVMSENEISLSVHGVTSNSATLKATTSNDDIYYMSYIKKSTADKMTDQEIADYMETSAGQFFTYLLSKGDDIIPTGATLNPSTEYYAIAYGWDWAVSTEIHKVPFTTLANVDAPDVPETIIVPDVEFGVLTIDEVTYESYHIVATPALEGSEYVLMVLSQSQIASCNTDEEIIKYVLNAIDALGVDYETNGDIYDAWGTYVKPLPTDLTQRAGVSSSYSYAAVAFGIDRESLQPTTKCVVNKFSTPAGAPAAAPAAPELPYHSTLLNRIR